MTRRLILTRHAKSSWDEPLLADHDRPLNKRGRASARALGNWLRRCGYLPDQVLSSSSERTRETLARMKLDAEASYLRSLYLADATTMRDTLRGARGTTVMMLGHNPGCGDFAEQLVARPAEHDRFLDYPTGATTVIDFAIDDWAQLEFGSGSVRDFVIPRELPE